MDDRLRQCRRSSLKNQAEIVGSDGVDLAKRTRELELDETGTDDEAS